VTEIKDEAHWKKVLEEAGSTPVSTCRLSILVYRGRVHLRVFNWFSCAGCCRFHCDVVRTVPNDLSHFRGAEHHLHGRHLHQGGRRQSGGNSQDVIMAFGSAEMRRHVEVAKGQ
jgi:hypothetical protein